MKQETEFVELNKVIHDREGFDCGENELNIFLKTRAAKHMQVGISKTMVLFDPAFKIDDKYLICAFYTIAPSSIKRKSLPAKLAKKLPCYPVPVFLIAQLAVNIEYQGKGLGKITLIKSLEHLWKINSQMSAYAVIVDCLNDKVESFYKKYGFKTLCDYDSKSRMYIPMKIIEKLFA